MVITSALVEVVVLAAAAAGVGEDRGLKKSANVFFLAGDAVGEGEAAAVAPFFLCVFFAAGEDEASGEALLAAAGDALSAASFFL